MVRLERPDLEEKRNQLIVRINADKSELKVLCQICDNLSLLAEILFSELKMKFYASSSTQKVTYWTMKSLLKH